MKKKSKICLDTGIIALNFSKNTPEKIVKLFVEIREGKIDAYILSPVLVEVFNHLCISDGKNFAEIALVNLQKEYPVRIINLSPSLIIKSGDLKCQYRKRLSYIDCMSIAYSINEKMTFFTTEKNLPKITSLKEKKYEF